MAALPYMQLYVADYLADTMHLSTEEHGAYLLLIFNYWQTGKPIPKVRLARIARLTNDRWLSVEDSLKEFFNDNGTEWEHSRIDRDLAAVHAAQEQKAAAGKASAQARKKKKQTEQQREGNDRSNSVEGSLKEFFNDNGTEWEHSRIDRDLAAVHAAQEQKAAAGKASAQARKKKKQTEQQREGNDRSNSVEGSFEQNPTIIDTDTDTDLKETPPPAREDDFDSRVRFAMTADWQPNSKTFQAVLLQMGITQQAFDQDQFLEFRSFWLASPDDHRTQAKWEHALASHLKRNLRQAQAGGYTHGSQGPATAEANQQRARGQGPAGQNGRHQREDRSAPGRVRAAIAERQQREQAAAGVAGQAVAEDVGDVRPPLDVEFWRIG
ncbi:DUF1376 domain-containing protein [Pseudomonas asiatica]|uniref:DUF1376 domain-containing protein n=1 Tax=Pseudomonas asiatica TaxID=2219225 RepID=UPI001E3DCF39|nr:DUF1376 domain-containing protein [Pseudomonas asiatica]MCE0853000.1 DUF1376 domain-containing protein [Pseudomonas asiatica]